MLIHAPSDGGAISCTEQPLLIGRVTTPIGFIPAKCDEPCVAVALRVECARVRFDACFELITRAASREIALRKCCRTESEMQMCVDQTRAEKASLQVDDRAFVSTINRNDDAIAHRHTVRIGPSRISREDPRMNKRGGGSCDIHQKDLC